MQRIKHAWLAFNALYQLARYDAISALRPLADDLLIPHKVPA